MNDRMINSLNRSQAAEEAENLGSNPSPNPTMGEIIAARYNRRDLLRGALAVTAICATVSPLAIASADRAEAHTNTTPSFHFKEIAADPTTRCTWEGYDADILIRWGDPVLPGAPPFDPTKPTAEAQAKQFGYNNDYLGYFPLDATGWQHRRPDLAFRINAERNAERQATIGKKTGEYSK